MANVQHSSLTGAELHEPKGADSASSGEVYVSDGAGSGAWGLAETLEATKDVTGTDGYVKLPGGVILQWGQITVNGDSTATITWPLAFPTACIQAIANFGTAMSTGQSNQDPFVSIYNLSVTGANCQNANNQTSVIRYFSIGY